MSIIEDIRTMGKAPLKFQPSRSMRESLKLSESYTFTTHKQLDTFIAQLKAKEEKVNQMYPMEWMILQAIDRAFWLLHVNDIMDEKFQPIDFDMQHLNFQYGFKNNCPFVKTGRFYPGAADGLSLLETAFGNVYY